LLASSLYLKHAVRTTARVSEREHARRIRAGQTCERQTPTLIWDLDRQLPADDPLRAVPNAAVGEFALLTTPGARRLSCPVPDELVDAADAKRLARRIRELPLVYVGNQPAR
jgi:hypothetical protein